MSHNYSSLNEVNMEKENKLKSMKLELKENKNKYDVLNVSIIINLE